MVSWPGHRPEPLFYMMNPPHLDSNNQHKVMRDALIVQVEDAGHYAMHDPNRPPSDEPDVWRR